MIKTWTTDKDEAATIWAIACRASQMAKNMDCKYDPMTADMDVSAAHVNGNPLQLTDLLSADDFNFAHDVFGIRRHLNRETGQLENGFLPRFTA